MEELNRIELVKPNKSTPYYNLLIRNPFAFNAHLDKNELNIFEIDIGLSKTDLLELVLKAYYYLGKKNRKEVLKFIKEIK